MLIFYGPKEIPEAPELGQEVIEEATSLGAHPPTRGHPLAYGPLGHPPDLFLMPKILINTKTPEKNPRLEVPPPQAFVAMKKSGACSGTLPERETITGGHLHHPAWSP